MTDLSKAKPVSTKVASETSTNANGLCKTTTSAANIRRTCNICNKACTKRCALCRLVFYCSAECQRLDWKRGHKKNCKGKQNKKKAPPASCEAEKTTVKKTKKKHVTWKDDGGLTLESLPDGVLVHIGKTVLEFCSIPDYLALAGTSKRFQSLLTDSEIISSLSKAEYEQILSVSSEYHRASMGAFLGDLPQTLKELRLWQIASELIQCNKVYFFDLKNVKDDLYKGKHILWYVFKILELIPKAQVILETHMVWHQHEDDTYQLGMSLCSGVAHIYSLAYPGTDAESIAHRFFFRPWDNMAAVTTLFLGDREHFEKGKEHFEKGKAFVDIFFRLEDGTEFPPRSNFYNGLPPLPLCLFVNHHRECADLIEARMNN